MSLRSNIAILPQAQYQTTSALIILLHILFWYQWRYQKRYTCNIKEVSELRRYHRALFGLVCYYQNPIEQELSVSSSSDIAVPLVLEQEVLPVSNGIPSFSFSSSSLNLSALYRYLRYGMQRLTSNGFLLMAYSCHLLWQFRALEEFFGGSWKYARILLVLGVNMSVLEIYLLHWLNRMYLRNVSQRRRTSSKLMAAPRIGLTSVLSALIVIFGTEFPFAKISVLPILPSFLVRFQAGDLGFTFTLLSLFYLARHSHPCAIMIGLVTGSLYRTGFISWVAMDVYWFIWFIVVIILFCSASLKADGVNVLCIDYVSFGANHSRIRNAARAGEIQLEHNEVISQSQPFLANDSLTSIDDDNENDDEYVDLETGQTISHQAPIRELNDDNSNITSEEHRERNRDD